MKNSLLRGIPKKILCVIFEVERHIHDDFLQSFRNPCEQDKWELRAFGYLGGHSQWM